MKLIPAKIISVGVYSTIAINLYYYASISLYAQAQFDRQ